MRARRRGLHAIFTFDSPSSSTSRPSRSAPHYILWSLVSPHSYIASSWPPGTKFATRDPNRDNATGSIEHSKRVSVTFRNRPAEVLKGSHGLKSLMQWRWRATRVARSRFGRGEIGNKLRRMTDERGTHITRTHLANTHTLGG
ncbi:hypothetical protein CPAR01_09239 [Colletotrichum paranaense]|uniref:Uncharacterized protein n=1 Tax=Colletotrichum paranaense TaxID=1914294 RepID=A0ABQ9SG60_9PEZI|nr:uncharacterized protein CPAR01_09239 [Colletotrichum paranaense]KAK1535697.1 hypothetical protein CPAR01_09239 [Colletotrichum paranaense]